MNKPGSGLLEQYKGARALVAEAARVDEVKEIRDRAVAFQAYNRQRKDRTMEAKALEIRCWAERRLGEELNRQGRKPGQRGIAIPPETRRAVQEDAASGMTHEAVAEKHGISRQAVGRIAGEAQGEPAGITYAELGISDRLGGDCKKLAKLHEDDFTAALGDVLRGVREGKRKVSKDILRFAAPEPEPPPEPQLDEYQTIVIHPGTETDWTWLIRHFRPPVPKEGSAHVMLIVPEGEGLWKGFDALEAWGVRYSATMTIEHEPVGDTAEGIRINSTLALYGRWGRPEWTQIKGFATAFAGSVPSEEPGSAPPELIEALSKVTAGTRVDYMAPRKPAEEGWEHWGPHPKAGEMVLDLGRPEPVTGKLSGGATVELHDAGP